MNSLDAFWKLGRGLKFDYKRFKADAVKLGLTSKTKTASRTPAAVNVVEQEIINVPCESENELVPTVDSPTLLSPTPDKPATESGKKRKRKPSSKLSLAMQHKEEVNHARKQHKIYVWGTDIPEPCTSFDQLARGSALPERLMQNITTLGYSVPTPIQMQVIPIMLQRREVLACAPTGSGKTAAFAVPLLAIAMQHTSSERGIKAVIVTPTRELAKQTFHELERLGDGLAVKLFCLEKASKLIHKPTSGIKKKLQCDLLISTPNRLISLLEQEPVVLDLSHVLYLIVDESDKLFETGKRGFRNQLATIYRACDSTHVRRGFFSATFNYEVEQWCKLNLDNVIMTCIGPRNTAVETVEQSLVFVGSEHGKIVELRNMVRAGTLEPPALIFVQSKERAKQLFRELLYDGIRVDVIHAERTQLQRDNVVKAFRTGDVWVLICTELMGRGIDFKGVRLVVNFDFPTSPISYIHRIGRSGRAGQVGRAITFFTEQDAALLRTIADVMRTAGCPVPDYMLSLNKPSKKMRKLMAASVPARPNISRRPVRRRSAKPAVNASTPSS